MAVTKEIEQVQNRRIVPKCSIWDENGKVILALEIPGVGKDDVSISVENDELKIVGRRYRPARESTYVLRERSPHDYFSSFTLDNTVDRDRIEAETGQGILTVTLHLKDAVKPRQISVKEIK